MSYFINGRWSLVARKMVPDMEFFAEASMTDPFFLKRSIAFFNNTEGSWDVDQRLAVMEVLIGRYYGMKGQISHEDYLTLQEVGKVLKDSALKCVDLLTTGHEWNSATKTYGPTPRKTPTSQQSTMDRLIGALYNLLVDWIN